MGGKVDGGRLLGSDNHSLFIKSFYLLYINRKLRAIVGGGRQMNKFEHVSRVNRC